jgi:hypothetical protein
MPANLDILATTSGGQAITKLETQLGNITRLTTNMNQANEVAQIQNRIEINQLARRNQLLIAKTNLSNREITTLAAQTNLNENLNATIQQRMSVEQEALRLRQLLGREGIRISLEEARVATTTNQQIIASEQMLEQQLRAKRRALMQVSISLFVMNISANQLVSALKPLVKENEAATQSLNDFSALLNLSLGPMQLFLALLQIQAALQISVAESATIMGAAMGAAFFFLLAFRQEAPVIRAALAGVAGVMAAFAIVSAQAALANTVLAGSLATLVSAVGGPVGLAIGLAATGAAVAFITGLLPSGQTLTDQQKRVKRSGIAEIHEGEVISRPGRGFAGAGFRDIIIQMPPGSRATPEEGASLARGFVKELNMGKGRPTSRRVSING